MDGVYMQKSCIVRTLVIITLLFSCSACCSQRLYISQEPVSKDTLASTHVNSPDPRHKINSIGQRLFISWKLPAKMFKSEGLRGILKVRYFNEEQIIIPFEIKHMWGHYVYTLVDQEYFDKKGIMTYKAEIVRNDGSVVKEWKHQLWAELISFTDK